jgi:DNA-binding transcriptional MerR regulator
MKTAEQENRLKISELAELSGVTIPTIRYYLQENLLPPPTKTGKTMAYYDRACVDRIKLIKRLQKERFLPIEVIRRLLDSGEAYAVESEIGQVISKADMLESRGGAVPGAEIVERTGYSQHKIDRLARTGLVEVRQDDSGPCFDALDVELIKTIKRGEEAGIPLEFSIESVRMYQKAIDDVVSRNTARVLSFVINDVPPQSVAGVLREVEDSLDLVVVLLRQKIVRRINETALRDLNELPDKLRAMNVFPVPGRHLPETRPADPAERLFYYFCTGNLREILKAETETLAGLEPDWQVAGQVLACLLLDRPEEAVGLVERHWSSPMENHWRNGLGALAYLQAAACTSGLTMPFKHMKKAWSFLNLCEKTTGGPRLPLLLTRYVCGAIYVVIPKIFGLEDQGLRLLAEVRTALRQGKFGLKRKSPWFRLTLEEEIIPALELKINGLLAEGFTGRLKHDSESLS